MKPNKVRRCRRAAPTLTPIIGKGVGVEMFKQPRGRVRMRQIGLPPLRDGTTCPGELAERVGGLDAVCLGVLHPLRNGMCLDGEFRADQHQGNDEHQCHGGGENERQQKVVFAGPDFCLCPSIERPKRDREDGRPDERRQKAFQRPEAEQDESECHRQPRRALASRVHIGQGGSFKMERVWWLRRKKPGGLRIAGPKTPRFFVPEGAGRQRGNTRKDVIGHDSDGAALAVGPADGAGFDDIEQPKQGEGQGDADDAQAVQRQKRDHLPGDLVDDDPARVVMLAFGLAHEVLASGRVDGP